MTTNLKTVSSLKNIGFPNIAHNYTQQRKSATEYDAIYFAIYLSATAGLFIVLFSKVRERLLMSMTSLNRTSLHLIYIDCHGARLLYFNLMCLNVTLREYLTLLTHFNLSGGVCAFSRHLPRFYLSTFLSV